MTIGKYEFLFLFILLYLSPLSLFLSLIRSLVFEFVKSIHVKFNPRSIQLKFQNSFINNWQRESTILCSLFACWKMLFFPVGSFFFLLLLSFSDSFCPILRCSFLASSFALLIRHFILYDMIFAHIFFSFLSIIVALLCSIIQYLLL